MARIETTAEQTGDAIAAKRQAIGGAVARGMRSALLAVEAEAVKNLSGSNTDPAGAYPVPARTGNLRRDRTVQQPQPGIGVISFTADYAFAIHSGQVTQWAGRGKTRRVQVPARPFAQDAIDKVDPAHFVIDAVAQAVAA